MFQKRKGLSLVEMIVAVGLVGMLASFILINMSSTYGALAKTKEYTADAFTTMQQIEEKTMGYRETVSDGEFITLNLFSGSSAVEVGYYPFYAKASDREIQFYSLIGRTEFPEYPASKLQKFQINLTYSGAGFDGETAVYAVDGMRVESGKIEATPETKDIHYKELYQWYISRDGFTVAPFADGLDGDADGVLPVFPKDYKLLPGEDRSYLSQIKPAYQGHHLVLAATPVAKNTGKVGARVASDPIYISGYPYHATGVKPLVHLDTGMVKSEDFIDGNRKSGQLRFWRDFSEWFSETSGTHFAPAGSPAFQGVTFGRIKIDSVWADVRGYSIAMKTGDYFSGKLLSTEENIHTRGFSVFAVVSNFGNADVRLVSGDNAGSGTQTDWALSGNGFSIEGPGYSYSQSAGSLDSGGWAVVGGIIIPARENIETGEVIYGRAFHSINGVVDETAVVESLIVNLSNLYVGGLGQSQEFEIAELIILPRGLDYTSTEYQLINEYLMDKYGIS